MTQLGTQTLPLRVAIVGAGPSGFYVADSLFRSKLSVVIDTFDKLPTPYGLLRGGVAPDHQQMKTVGKYYEKVALTPGFSFFGNVTIGKDVSVDELKQHYDVIVFTCGAQTDKKMGISGEDKQGSYTATEFVGWYNGNPDYQDLNVDLSKEKIAIVGQGNVAIDVARILAKTRQELASSDITEHALSLLDKSHVKEIHLIGRRGPVQAAFTELEIKELGELEDCDVVIDPQDLILNEASQIELDDPANNKARKNMLVLQEFAKRSVTNKAKKIVLHFFKSPLEVLGDTSVKGLRLGRNHLEGSPNQQKAVLTDQHAELQCDLIFRSVGYRGVRIEGVPFDDAKGIFPNQEGRMGNAMYCSGWIKRGPSGVLGSNKPDGAQTVQSILQDLESLTPCPFRDSKAVLDILTLRNVRVVTFEDWKKIDTEELNRGQALGKPREKMTSITQILEFLS